MLWLSVQSESGTHLFQGVIRHFPFTLGSSTLSSLCYHQHDLPQEALRLTEREAGWVLRIGEREWNFSSDLGLTLTGLRLTFRVHASRLSRISLHLRPGVWLAFSLILAASFACLAWTTRKTNRAARQTQVVDVPYPGQILWSPRANEHPALTLTFPADSPASFLLAFYASSPRAGQIHAGSSTIDLTPGQIGRIYSLQHAGTGTKPLPLTWRFSAGPDTSPIRLQNFALEPLPIDCESPPLPGTREAKALDHMRRCLALHKNETLEAQYRERQSRFENQLTSLLYEIRRSLRQGERTKALQTLALYRELIDDPHDPRMKSAQRLLKKRLEVP